MKFQRLYLHFRGSASHWHSWEYYATKPEVKKIQDGGLLTSNAYISASRHDINEIPTALPTFSGSSFPLALMGILCDQTGSGKIQDGGL